MSLSRHVVYCHTNKFDGKKYVGITKNKPEVRWNNGNGYRNNEYFYRAIKKYGWHNFTHEILYTNLTEQEAEQMEIQLIKEYECYKKENGYNIHLGGNSGHKFTDESKEKLRNALKGKPKSEETKRKISEAHKGKTASEETRAKISESLKGESNPMYGKKRDASIFKTKPVRCIETGEEFVSANEASRRKNISSGSVSRACNGKLKTAGRLHWEFIINEEE